MEKAKPILHVTGDSKGFIPAEDLAIRVIPLESGDFGAGFSAVKIQVTDAYMRSLRYNKTGHAAYYLLDGKCILTTQEENKSMTKGNLIVVPPETPYAINGNCELLALSNPPFKSKNVHYMGKSTMADATPDSKY